jgi:hypothetical protein
MPSDQTIIAYIYQHYPNPFMLGIARLMKILFIADWRSSQQNRRLLSVQWMNTYGGPHSDEVVEALCSDTRHFEIEYRGTKEESKRALNFIVSPRQSLRTNDASVLPEDTKKLLNTIIADTARENLDALDETINKLLPVRSTRPVVIAMPGDYRPNAVKVAPTPVLADSTTYRVQPLQDVALTVAESAYSYATKHPGRRTSPRHIRGR